MNRMSKISKFLNVFLVGALLFAHFTGVFTPVGAEEIARNTPAISSGLVQFVLEPLNWNTDWGTLDQARAAAMNVGTVVHHLYANSTINALSFGVNGRYGRDAIFLGQANNRYRVMIAGAIAYVRREGTTEQNVTINVDGTNRTVRVRAVARFVPFDSYPNNTAGTNVRSMSHYVNRNGELWRYLTRNAVAGTAAATGASHQRFLTGPAPSWMTQNRRYYSFDGVFFYLDPRNIRENGAGAVNENNPHFNYFQYLSFRSTSRVTAEQLDNFLANGPHGINTATSVMRGQGHHFINAGNRYGINPLLMFAKAMLESAGGTSAIARNNNNIFGQGAVDSAPERNAWHFPTVRDSIDNLARGWLSEGYLWPADGRHHGPHAGHKGSGMNVRYATDPYWGQKIAGWAFRIDRTLNNQDRNRYQIGILQNTNTVAVTNAAGGALYTANPRNNRFFPFLLIGTSGNRLRIVTDPAIQDGVINRTALFNRATSIGYIPNANLWRTGAGSPNAPGGGGDGGGYRYTHLVAPATGTRRTGRTIRTAHFRTGPGTNHSTIRVITSETNVAIIGMTGDWRKVRIGNTDGWIHRSHIRETVQLGRTRRQAHFRAGAGTSHRTIRVLPAGTQLTVVGWTLPGNFTDLGLWLRVRIGSEYGWVHRSHVQRHRNVATNTQTTTYARGALRQAPAAASRYMRTLNAGTRVTVLGHSGDGLWTQVRVGNETGWMQANHAGERGRTSASVNLRLGAGTNHGIIRTLPNNTALRVIRRSVGGRWVQVRAGNDTGWISAEFFRN